MKKIQLALTIALMASSLTAVKATVISEAGFNDTLETAQNINPYFSLDFSQDIGDTLMNTSMVIPHVTIQGLGDETYDVYAFTTTGGRAIFDIDVFRDNGDGLGDSYLRLFDFTGNSIAANDDAPDYFGQLGTSFGFDSYLELALSAGNYFIRVGSCCESPARFGYYTLQVSVENQSASNPVPEPASLALLGLGVLGLVAAGRSKAA